MANMIGAMLFGFLAMVGLAVALANPGAALEVIGWAALGFVALGLVQLPFLPKPRDDPRRRLPREEPFDATAEALRRMRPPGT